MQRVQATDICQPCNSAGRDWDSADVQVGQPSGVLEGADDLVGKFVSVTVCVWAAEPKDERLRFHAYGGTAEKSGLLQQEGEFAAWVIAAELMVDFAPYAGCKVKTGSQGGVEAEHRGFGRQVEPVVNIEQMIFP